MAAPATTEPATTTAFTDAWETFFRSVRRARGRAAANAEGLTVPQYHLLEPLGFEGALPVGALAAEAGVAAPTATRMLDCLVRDGYVTRSTSPHDRRVVLIGLTRAGERALAERREKVTGARRRIEAGLSAAERREATVLLRRLADLVEDL